jgi:hypothetical protein
MPISIADPGWHMRNLDELRARRALAATADHDGRKYRMLNVLDEFTP